MILLTALSSALASSTITPVPVDVSTLPPALSAEAGIAWDDASGHNVLTWSRGEEVHISHHVTDGETLFWYRDLIVEAPPCDDGDLSFAMDDAVTLTDADGDGIGEVSFAITSGCLTDMSARDLDIYLWEAGTEHRLRGETVWWELDGAGTVTAPSLSDSLSDSPALAQLLRDRYVSTAQHEPSLSDAPVSLRFVTW